MINQELAIDIRELTKHFGNLVAVDGVSFGVSRGEVFAFLGPNGSGKSTTIRMLCGILRPTSGYGRVLDFDIIEEGEQVKRHIGYMNQRFALYEDLTVRENLEFYAGIYGVTATGLGARLAELVAMAGLSGRERQLAGQLSGGWKQRLALGCAIVHEPPLLFLDEPTAGVDPVSRREFWTMIHGLAQQGTTVFVTTHYLDEAEHANRVAMIHSGVLRALGSPAELKATALHGELFELLCRAPMEATALLKGTPGVREAVLFGSMVRVLVDPGGLPISVPERLAEAGITLHNVRRVEPTLEDVFISLLGDR